ncbi:MAG: sigma-70 family RNA polymerase sigma factor [Actinomycetota bacterium]
MTRRDRSPLRSYESWYAEAAEGLVRSVTASIGDPVVAREATAEALARAFERWDSVGAMDSPAGWVHTTAVNLCRRSWRRRAIERRALAKMERQQSSHIVVDGAGEQATDARVALAPHLDRLSPRMRTAIELRYWHGLTEAEIARRMDVSVGTASALLSQARQRLAHHLPVDEPLALAAGRPAPSRRA